MQCQSESSPGYVFWHFKRKGSGKKKSNDYFNRSLPHPFPAIDALPLEPLVPLDPFEPPLLFPARVKGSFSQDWGLINPPPMLVWIDLGHMLTPKVAWEKDVLSKNIPAGSHHFPATLRTPRSSPLQTHSASLCPYPSLQTCLCPDCQDKTTQGFFQVHSSSMKHLQITFGRNDKYLLR